MTREYYLSDDYIIKNGVLNAIVEIMSRINSTSIMDLFDCFETIHKILVKYEDKANNRVSELNRDQCVFRYKQYKKYITDNRQFLTADIIRKILAVEQSKIHDMKGYGLCYCIEETYFRIDFIMRTIAEHISHLKNSSSKYFKIKGYHDQEKAIMIENNKGLSFVLDRDTNKGFIGYFKGTDIIRDRTKTVSDDEYWEFVEVGSNNGATYELI